MLAHVVRRVRNAQRVDLVVVATTVSPDDDEVEAFCRANAILVTRGSVNDVLSRYHDAATSLGADVVVRVTADCPFIDPSVVDDVVREFLKRGQDYVSNVNPPTYPDGLDTEVFTAAALALAAKRAALPSEREHVTPFIRNHPELFRLANVSLDDDLSAMRWTVDEPADLAFVRAVASRMGSMDFGFRELAAMIRSDDTLEESNRGIERNAGYAKSLREDAAPASSRETMRDDAQIE